MSDISGQMGIDIATLLQDCQAFVAVYVIPPSPGVTESIAIEVIGGPKAYARIYASNPNTVDWGWVIHDTAVCVWRAPDVTVISADEYQRRTGRRLSDPPIVLNGPANDDD